MRFRALVSAIEGRRNRNEGWKNCGGDVFRQELRVRDGHSLRRQERADAVTIELAVARMHGRITILPGRVIVMAAFKVGRGTCRRQIAMRASVQVVPATAQQRVDSD